jgi:hypothetical protein
MRTSSTAAMLAWEHRELWWAHVVVLSADDRPVTEKAATIGPRLSLAEVSNDAGELAGRMAKEALEPENEPE